MSKFGLKKNIGVPDWIDIFTVVTELIEHCGSMIAFNGWNNVGILGLLQKLLHPGNKHNIRLPSLELLLLYTTTLADHSSSNDHLTLLKAAVLAGFEPLMDIRTPKPGMPFNPRSNIQTVPNISPSASDYLKELSFTHWNTQPMACLKTEHPLTLKDHSMMLLKVLKFATSKASNEGRRSDSIGGQQGESQSRRTEGATKTGDTRKSNSCFPFHHSPITDANMTLVFWSNVLHTHIFPALLPHATSSSMSSPYKPPTMSKGVEVTPFQILELFEDWINHLIEEGGSALDIFWSNDAKGNVMYECFKSRFQGLSDTGRHGMLLRTLRQYAKIAEAACHVPKHILKAPGGACVTFAGHVSSLLISPKEILENPNFEEAMNLCVSMFEIPLEKTIGEGNLVTLVDLLLNILKSTASNFNLSSGEGIPHDASNRLLRALLKASAKLSIGSGDVEAATQKKAALAIRDWVKLGEERKVFANSILLEWRQTLLDLNKILIFNVAIGADMTVERVRKNSRWQVEGSSKWLKTESSVEALKIYKCHLGIFDAAFTDELPPKLHLMAIRSISDVVRMWVNEAIIPDRHYRPPPRRGADKDKRNESKERAKVEEFDLASPLVQISPMTILNMVGVWLFKGAEKGGKEYREGRFIAIETLMKLLCARTFTHLDAKVEKRILFLVRKSFLKEDKGSLIVIVRMMGELFTSDVPGVSGLVVPFLGVTDVLMNGLAVGSQQGGGKVFLGNQTKMALMKALCSAVTVIYEFGDVKGGPGPDDKPLNTLKARLGDTFIKLAEMATATEDLNWIKFCATGLYLLLTCELGSQDEGNSIEDFHVRHWVLTLCEWCNR